MPHYVRVSYKEQNRGWKNRNRIIPDVHKKTQNILKKTVISKKKKMENNKKT